MAQEHKAKAGSEQSGAEVGLVCVGLCSVSAGDKKWRR